MREIMEINEGETMEINKDLIAASSTPMVLAILAEEDSYGYAILKRVRELSGGRMEWTDGMRAEDEGFGGGGKRGGTPTPLPRESAGNPAARLWKQLVVAPSDSGQP